jgi:hypothetical protein
MPESRVAAGEIARLTTPGIRVTGAICQHELR